jgi:hypothetical protein
LCRLPLNCDLPTYASHITGIKDMYHYAWFICWDRVLPTFCPGWPQTVILQTFAFWELGFRYEPLCLAQDWILITTLKNGYKNGGHLRVGQ